MSSWFSTISSTVASVSEKVSNAIPLDKELLDKLTLNTDEMKATREQFGEEATRKAAAKDLLAKMLPWDTKDKERDILVDECKEAILALSADEVTFYGPFEMPELDVNMEEDEDEKKKSGDGDDSDEEEEEEEVLVDEEDEEEKRKRLLPSEESLEKLAQLEPLPPLLQDFDLECHVGLIQMILKEDPKLVEMQSNISGGGKREEIFWRNYFFHCAYTRYEAGLSIDEIWSFSPEAADAGPVAETAVAEKNESDEEQVIFDDKDASIEAPEPAFSPDETNTTDEATPAEPAAETPKAAEEPDAIDLNADFDFLDDEDDAEGPVDPEMDELEAEIMAELED
eukprot:CAMPEP_0113623106 /NCGR_PEP_ID=MMETSP0017_2-20120614/11878_1 /TAXON_ID=2856 /ORGANISM="Cylindrotheca closterium" /LENGTH=339 /DNA_ID=CAMNT_0000533029 /DNA_START=73 /DNA_END=1092 /DNA_ORIENTATION=- /assembly_acc=CAM_ASM_000147